MPKMRIKKGDTVLVLSGKDKGKRAKVLEVDPQEGKVLVEGVNVKKKHTKPRPPKVPQGGILEKAHPVDRSNLIVVCPHCQAPTRFKARVKDDVKERVCRKCDEVI